MNETRQIRDIEKEFIVALLAKLNLTTEDYPIDNEVFEYEGGKMGSISIGNKNPDDYDGDLIQVEYNDIDGVPVLITLTKNKYNQLLDLDFWKEDFSALIIYPKIEEVIVRQMQGRIAYDLLNEYWTPHGTNAIRPYVL